MEKTIRVTGKGSMQLKPDLTVIELHLTQVFPAFEEATSASAAQTKEIKDALEPLGFGREEIKTTAFSVDPERESYQDGNGRYQNRLVGYRYHHRLRFSFDVSNERLGKVLYALSQIEAEAEFDVKYTVKDAESAKNKLLGLAVEDSRRKAEALAQAADVRLGEIVNIDYARSEPEFVSRPFAGDMMRTCKAAALTHSIEVDVQPDDIRTSDTVTIVWAID